MKARWEKFYSSFDPYGQEKWYSDRMRRKSTLDLLFSRGLMFNNCLELGCGEGRITNKTLEICKKITAVDLSSNAIKEAKIINQNNLNRIEFIESDMYEVNFESNSFDLINGIESLDYTKKWKEEIDKWIYWLKPGGYIIFSGPNLPGYFRYKDIINLFKIEELNIIETKVVTTKFPLQGLISRIPLLQNSLFWAINLFFAKLFPRLFAKHMAILAKKKEL